MTRSKRMRPVRRVADERADAAAKRYAEAQQKLAQQQARLLQLQGFRGDYQAQRVDSAGGGMDGFRLRDYNAFIARIDEAIRQQHSGIDQAAAEAERLRLQWLELLGRARAIDKVVVRYEGDERREDERKSQRENDELAGKPRRPGDDDSR